MDYPIADIASKVNNLGSAWEQFKSVNDARLRELEQKGAADPIYDDQLNKINTAIDSTRAQVKRMETAFSRPFSSAIETKAYESADVTEYKHAFDRYLRKGEDSGLNALEQKALSVGNDADGGYLVTPAMSERIVQEIRNLSPMRQLCAVETISTEALDVIQDVEDAVANWTTETGAVTDTTTPQISKKSISVHELYAQPTATQKLVDDAAIDIENWVATKVSDIFAKMENTAFISGTGSGQPKGILTYAAGTAWNQIEQIDSGSDGQVTADGITNLFYSLDEGYAARASFMMHRTALQQVRLLKSSGGEYLWQPGLSAGQPDTLLGVPVVTSADMPVPTTDSLSVILADFQSAYQIVDRHGVRILRDPYTSKPFVRFYSTKRVGGDVVNFYAAKILKLAA